MAEKHLHDDRAEILATGTPSREDFQRCSRSPLYREHRFRITLAGEFTIF
jgi:hypothetical protein